MEKKIYDELFLLERDYWWHVSKRRLVFDFIRKLNLTTDSKVLDVGCGTGIVMKELAVYFDSVSGIDISSLALSYCKKRGLRKITKSDLGEKLLYNANKFDLVTCLDVLEHVENDGRAVKEIFRVLEPGGTVIFTVPAFKFLWTKHDELLWHKRRYTLKQMVTLLEKSGFNIKRSTCFYSFLFFPAVILFKITKLMFNKGDDDPHVVPSRVVNNLLLIMCSIERWFIALCPMPFGLSLFVVAEKK